MLDLSLHMYLCTAVAEKKKEDYLNQFVHCYNSTLITTELQYYLVDAGARPGKANDSDGLGGAPA